MSNSTSTTTKKPTDIQLLAWVKFNYPQQMSTYGVRVATVKSMTKLLKDGHEIKGVKRVSIDHAINLTKAWCEKNGCLFQLDKVRA